MATVIKPKRGSGAPGLGDIVQNEIAIDETNGVLYVRDTGNTIIPVGKNLVDETAPALSDDLNVDGNALTGTTIINNHNSLEKIKVTNNGVKQLADYSHPFIQYGEPGVEGGELHTWVFGGAQFGLVNGVSNTTANGYQMFEFRARHDTQAQPDDGLHMGDLTIFGEDNSIMSHIAEDFSNDLKPLSIASDGLRIKADANNVTDTQLRVQSDVITANVPIQLPTYTTTERNALSPDEGWMIYNQTDAYVQVWDGSAWFNL